MHRKGCVIGWEYMGLGLFQRPAMVGGISERSFNLRLSNCAGCVCCTTPELIGDDATLFV